MKRFLLDTGIAADYIYRRRGVYDRARDEVSRGNRIGICVPVLGELYFGCYNSTSPKRNKVRLQSAITVWTIWPYTEQASEDFGRLSAQLRKAGRPMQQVDVMVAAIARTLGNCTVVSSDSDFLAVPGLDVENWAV